jgi:anti-sigma factor RsiW
MENHIPMYRSESRDEMTIKYVMGELDPAEAAEFRVLMQQDQNLLIEAESLKQTLRRLDSLPLISAPASVLELVKKQAARKQRGILYRFRYVAAAAVLILVVSASLYFNGMFSTKQPVAPALAAEPVEALKQPEESKAVKISKPQKTVNTWKDRKNVVTIDQVLPESENDKIPSSRLKPVSAPSGPSPAEQRITLTKAN